MHTAKQHSEDTTTKGSFLLELLVAFTVISIAMTVVVDSFMSSQKSYRMIADQTGLTQALTMVLEDMSREARVSENFGCGVLTPSECIGTAFSMTHIEGLNDQGPDEDIVYTLTDNEIIKTKDGTDSKITTNTKIEVTDFSVSVQGEHGPDQVQALVTISAHTKDNPAQVAHVQTSFTERLF